MHHPPAAPHFQKEPASAYIRCAPQQSRKVLYGIAETETGGTGDPLQLVDTSTLKVYRPDNPGKALAIIHTLEKRGHNVAIGAFGLKSSNIARVTKSHDFFESLHLSIREAMVSPSPHHKRKFIMKNRHIFNRSFAFGISRKALIAMAILATFPAVAIAGPSVGLGYSNIGLSGHSGRPGVTITAGNLYSNNVVASGSASFARGYYGFNADLGKLIPAGGVSFEPYVSLGFLNLNYNQTVPGGIVTSHPYPFVTQYSQSYVQQPASTTDFYGLAGVNMNVPIGSKVAFLLGGGYGHTIDTFSGANGAVYRGKAELGFEIAPHVTANLNVRYAHVPGQSMTDEGAGLSYHFS